ncbi:MAG: hypothetical protein WD845_11330 [Pirellulales bacterium]
MQRTGAILLALAAIAGCRSSQQPINPFIRTTVPPPGTGEAAVVVPGDPYYPGSTPTPSPQIVTPMPQQGAAVTPIAPAPVQPVAPPTRDLKRSVPGGNLFYHQSSLEPSKQGDEGSQGEELAVNSADPDALALGGRSDAVAQALALAQEPQPFQTVRFEDYGGRLPGEAPLGDATREPSARPSTPTQLQYSSQRKVRIVGTADDDSEEYEVDSSALEYDSSSKESSSAQGCLA